jgi:thiamine biosynthesis protein ThiS
MPTGRGQAALPHGRGGPILGGMSGLTITINGERRVFDAGTMSVAALLTVLELDGRKVAVELNEEIVPRSRYLETMLASGDALEVVHFIGGG